MPIIGSTRVETSTHTYNGGQVIRMGGNFDIHGFYMVWSPAGGAGTTSRYVELVAPSTGSWGFRGNVTISSSYGYQNSIGMTVYHCHYGANQGSVYSRDISTRYSSNMGQYSVDNWNWDGSKHRFRIQNTTRASNPMWVYVATYGDSYRGVLSMGGQYGT